MNNPFNFPKELFDEMSQQFKVERNGNIIGSASGVFCGRDYPSTIQLFQNADVKNGDWIIDTITQQRYYAKDVHPIVVAGTVHDWMIKYQTEEDYLSSHTEKSNTTINIQNVNGNSAIGSQANVVFNINSSLSDIESIIKTLSSNEQLEAQELLDTLKRTANATHPVLVEGALSKFSNLIKKHTDLLTAIGGWAVQLLIGNK